MVEFDDPFEADHVLTELDRMNRAGQTGWNRREAGAAVATLLALAGCAASSPPAPPFAVAYRWPDPGAGILALRNHQPPAEITVHYNPAAVSPKAVANFAQSTCLAWNRRPSPETPASASPGVVRFRCDRPLIATSENR